ncbi:MAG: hypothetical protein NW224_20035 [Leptolyngbyaceae cyanobacterium bins.302]|nr:hypothetical protein [Leptolyngbyaceae cyanobacterium bins.302]
MSRNNHIYRCRVCGFLHEEPPWGDDGKTPTFNICECCGTEFGYEDATPKAIQSARKNWLSNGAKWYLPEFRPSDWDLSEQLKNIPKDPDHR